MVTVTETVTETGHGNRSGDSHGNRHGNQSRKPVTETRKPTETTVTETRKPRKPASVRHLSCLCPVFVGHDFELPVSFFSVSNAEDLDPIAVIVEAEAVIAETQTVLRRIDIGEPFHIAFFGGEKARQAVQQIDGGLAVDVKDYQWVDSYQQTSLYLFNVEGKQQLKKLEKLTNEVKMVQIQR